MAVEHGFSTHEQSTARLNGGNWKNNIEKLKQERSQLAQVQQEGAEEK